MRRPNRFLPEVHGVERRLSLSGLGAAPTGLAPPPAQLALENTMVSGVVSRPAPKPGGDPQIIAILIGL